MQTNKHHSKGAVQLFEHFSQNAVDQTLIKTEHVKIIVVVIYCNKVEAFPSASHRILPKPSGPAYRLNRFPKFVATHFKTTNNAVF